MKNLTTQSKRATVAVGSDGSGSAQGFWRSARGENHGRDSRPGDVWCEPGDITDTDRLDWLARNLMTISTPSAPDMSGVRYVGQLRNEARGSGGGPSYFRVNHRDLREAIDAAILWQNTKVSQPAQ